LVSKILPPLLFDGAKLDPVQKTLEPLRHTKGEDTKGHKETQRHTKGLCGVCPFWFVGKMEPDKAERLDEIA
jgi:hypothetical protein